MSLVYLIDDFVSFIMFVQPIAQLIIELQPYLMIMPKIIFIIMHMVIVNDRQYFH
jgi:hypothetical protein